MIVESLAWRPSGWSHLFALRCVRPRIEHPLEHMLEPHPDWETFMTVRRCAYVLSSPSTHAMPAHKNIHKTFFSRPRPARPAAGRAAPARSTADAAPLATVYSIRAIR